MMYLRHEAGHAFNYAYELYKTPEWRDLFGPFRRPYRDDYRPVPFSRRVRPPHRGLVRAEAPRRGLRRDVRRLADARVPVAPQVPGLGRRCAKLRYVDRIARKVRDMAPVREQRRDRHHRRRDGDDGRGVLRREARGAAVPRRPAARHGPRGHLQGLAPPPQRDPARGRPPPREPQGDRGQGRVLDGRRAAARQGARRGDRGARRRS